MQPSAIAGYCDARDLLTCNQLEMTGGKINRRLGLLLLRVYAGHA